MLKLTNPLGDLLTKMKDCSTLLRYNVFWKSRRSLLLLLHQVRFRDMMILLRRTSIRRCPYISW